MPFFMHIPSAAPAPLEHLYGTIAIARGDISLTVDSDTVSNVATGAANGWAVWYKLNESLVTELKGRLTCTTGYVQPQDIMALDNGSFFVSGVYTHDVTAHPAIGVAGSSVSASARYPGALQSECFLTYFNSLGVPQWIRRFGGTAGSPTRVFTMYLAKSGSGVACFTTVYQDIFTVSSPYFAETQLGTDPPTTIGSWPVTNFTYGQAITRISTTGAVTAIKKVTMSSTASAGGFPRINFLFAGRPSTNGGKIVCGYLNQQDDSFNIIFGAGETNQRTFLWPTNISSPSGANHRTWNYLALFDELTLDIQWVAAAEHFNTDGNGFTGPKGGFFYGSAILDDGSVAINMYTHNPGAGPTFPITRLYGDNLSAGLDTVTTPATDTPIATHILFGPTGTPQWAKVQVGGERQAYPYAVTRTPDDTILFMQEGGAVFGPGARELISFDEGNVTTSFATAGGNVSAPLDVFIKRDTSGTIIDSTYNRLSDLGGHGELGYSFHDVVAKNRKIWASSTWTKDQPLTLGIGEANETILSPDPLGPAVWVGIYDTDLSLIAARRLTTISGVSAGYNYLFMYKLSLATK